MFEDDKNSATGLRVKVPLRGFLRKFRVTEPEVRAGDSNGVKPDLATVA